jgi:hypothetical protein
VASEATHQPQRTRRPEPGRLFVVLNILAGILGILAAGMLILWAFAERASLGRQTPNPLAAFAWAVAWSSFATVGLCILLVPGLILCVRPTLFALVAPTPAASIRRWPRLTGLTFAWSGVWLIAIAAFPLTLVDQIALGLVPQSDDILEAALGTATLPLLALVLAGRLVPRRRQRPAAGDDPPSRLT